ncbi:MAG: GntR family transcriptional regulator [Albidovulum sp.]|nr:GntR family transcriptional regulator [Albidovulum sp.]MDE0534174.1 GntR family transcriptional regulator [Albidovulum sp.]
MPRLLQYGDGPQAICGNLRMRILAGEFSTGSELKIQSLAKEFGVSIMPVREALRMLATEGLVELRPRRSPLVAMPDIAEILEINEIRQALEPIALATAIGRHTRKSLSACRRIVEADRACTDRWKKVELNRKFHKQLLAPCRKARLLQAIEGQYSAMSLLAQYLVVRDNFVAGMPHFEHESILGAVEQLDSERALSLLRDHISQSSERLEKSLENRETGAA